VQSLSDDVYNTRAFKPITAKIDDMAASAAYWIASQAESIEANASALVGSIGVYTVMYDTSAAAKDAGVKVNVISSGDYKGSGVPGSEITDKQIEAEQQLINKAADMFIDAVARGRGLEDKEVRKSADGRVWFAADAMGRGLIDSVIGAKEEEKIMPQDKKKEEECEENAEETKALEDEEEEKEDMEEEEDKEEEEEEEKAETKIEPKAEVVTEDKQTLSLKQQLCASAILDGVNEGRVVGKMGDAVTKFAASCGYDFMAVKEFISSFPVQTRSNRVSESPRSDNTESKKTKLSKEDLEFGRSIGLKDEDNERLEGVVSVDINGNFIKEDEV
jgi:signal peptide peptidase SppA